MEDPLAKLSLRLPAVEGRGRFGILKGDRRGDGGVRVITENGRVFAAITGTTVTKQSAPAWVDHLLDNSPFEACSGKTRRCLVL